MSTAAALRPEPGTPPPEPGAPPPAPGAHPPAPGAHPPGPEPGLRALLWPRWRALRNAPRSRNGRGALRLAFFAVLGLAFMTASFFGARWLFTLFLQAEFLAELLIRRVLEMVLLFFGGLLVFSNTIGAFSTLFLADDLALLAAAPVSTGRLFLARLTENWLQASWMMLVFALPILAACGPVLGAGPGFYLALPLSLVPLTLICAAVGTVITLLLARLLPAQRTQELLLLLAVVAFLGLYGVFRAAEPERFLKPDAFGDLIALIGDLEAGEQALNPAAWVLSVLFAWVRDEPAAAARPALVLLLAAAASLSVATWIARLTWRPSLQRSLEGRSTDALDGAPAPGLAGLGARLRGLIGALGRRLPGAARRRLPGAGYAGDPMRALLQKETRTFFRSTGQWTQLLLIAVLVLVYVFNFKYFRTLQATGLLGRTGLFLAHVALGGLVLTTVAARFLYPILSLEGRAWWVLAAAPLRTRDLLRAKVRWGLGPLMLLGVSLAFAGDRIVDLSPAMAVAAAVLSAWVSYGLAGLAVGLGAADPRFDESNPARIAGGIGGVVFMLLGLGYVLALTALLALPIAALDGWLTDDRLPTAGRLALCAGLFVGAVALTLAAHQGALTWGARRLDAIER